MILFVRALSIFVDDYYLTWPMHDQSKLTISLNEYCGLKLFIIEEGGDRIDGKDDYESLAARYARYLQAEFRQSKTHGSETNLGQELNASLALSYFS